MRKAGASILVKPVSLALSLSLTAAVVIAAADVASASLFLIFERSGAPPGTVVHVRTGGTGACRVCPHHLSLYFAEAAVADDIAAPDDARLVRVGRLLVDERGDGSGVLTVPNVPNGRYFVMTSCQPCAPSSSGSVILPLGPFPPFRVVGSAVGRAGPMWAWIGGGLVAIVAAALAWFSVRRRSRLPPSRPATEDRGSP